MLRRTEFVRKVSKQADVRVDVTRDVIAALIDVIIDEVVNNKKFSLTHVFTIDKAFKKGYTAGGGHAVPDHTVLNVRVSPSLRSLHRLKEKFPEIEIDKDNWKKYVYRGGGANPDVVRELQQKSEDPKEKPKDNFHNPFLDESE